MNNEDISFVKELEEKCKSSGLKCEILYSGHVLEVEFPNKENGSLFLTTRTIAWLIKHQISFYDYRLFKNFNAIYSKKENIIECEVDLSENALGTELTFLNFIRSFQINSPFLNSHIQISEASTIFKTLTGKHSEDEKFYFSHILKNNPSSEDENFQKFINSPVQFSKIEDLSREVITIKLSNINIETENQAFEIISTFFAAICFDIEYRTQINIALKPTQYATLNLSPLNYIPFDLKKNTAYELTTSFYYNENALLLYWNTHSMKNIPLIQYLLLYQVIEYFFPIYSEQIIQTRIKNILRDPKFNINHDEKIAKLSNLITYKKFTDEKEQLKNTLNECIDINDLHEWLNQFIKTKNTNRFNSEEAKLISKMTIGYHNEKDDKILSEVVNRIYDIRCRIVHTKSDQNDYKTLHSRSSEVKYLEYDIELIKFLAKKVIIMSGKPYQPEIQNNNINIEN